MPRRVCCCRFPSILRRLPCILLTTPLLFSWPLHYPQKPVDTEVLLLQHSPTVKVVNGTLSLSISTCQYPAFTSNDVNITAPCRQSNDSSIQRRLYASFIVLEFNFLRSMQNLNEPSFFLTNTTGLPKDLQIS